MSPDTCTGQGPIDSRPFYTNNFTVPDQGFPGLQSRIVPKPDYGETCYTGSGRLAGGRALITGGD